MEVQTLSIPQMKMTDEEFLLMRNLIQSRLGINLTEQKKGLLITRLNKYMRTAGFETFQQYIDHLHKDQTGVSLGELADMISTNHTYFFRESKHFEFLSSTALPQIMTQLRAQKSLDFRMWCAAASTGEEPYGLMITLMEYLGSHYNSWDAGLLATDISREALNVAESGIYDDQGVSKIPVGLRNKYFSKTQEGNWFINNFVRSQITYRRFNLMRPEFPFKKPFHIIFCRNVMIYFDLPTIERLVNNLFQWTAPGGYLFVGFSESLSGIHNPYRYVSPAIYQKP
ncbi:MAG: protein-glutamate O-methyltransferase CheR [SAR324 cluster bacterium]|nr:protein-glutamate O-methyltransferase CheR [SAR324 cluster bacterium]